MLMEILDAPTPAGADNALKVTYLEFEFTELLMFLSPFSAFDSNGSGLFGIQNVTFNFTLESENCRAIRMENLGRIANDCVVSVQAYKPLNYSWNFYLAMTNGFTEQVHKSVL